MIFSFNTPIWFYPKPVDFRKQIDGLIIIVADQIKINPTSGQLFIFRNRSENKLKLLWWYRNAFWLCYVRLESGYFQFPKNKEAVFEMSREQLSWLLTGLNFMNYQTFSEVKVSNFY